MFWKCRTEFEKVRLLSVGVCFRREGIERSRTVSNFEAMKAIRVSSFGGPEVLELVSDVPIPSVSIGQVRIIFISLIFC